MPASWPAGVRQRFSPDIQIDGPRDTVLETEFDKGRPARRRNTLASPQSAPLRIPALPSDEVAAFETWFTGVLGGGAEPFEMPHPFTGAVRTWAFTGRPMYRVRFVAPSWFSLDLSLDLYPS